MVSCTIGKVQNDRLAGTLEKGRVIASLGGVALKALEAADPKSPAGARWRAVQQVPIESTPWSQEERKKKLKRLSLSQLDALRDILIILRAEDQAEG